MKYKDDLSFTPLLFSLDACLGEPLRDVGELFLLVAHGAREVEEEVDVHGVVRLARPELQLHGEVGPTDQIRSS